MPFGMRCSDWQPFAVRRSNRLWPIHSRSPKQSPANLADKSEPMPEHFFEQPILNSPYSYPARHWELDKSGQPTDQILASRRTAEFITPIPKPKK